MGLSSNRVEDLSTHACNEFAFELPISSNNNQEPLEVHRVCLPPHKTTLEKLRQRLLEVFFPDDPLHKFKNQTCLMKFFLGLQFFFPVFEWGPQYNLKLLRADIISGLTIASLAIPQGISYAKLANLPPIVGLYSSFVPPLIYSVLGSSKHLAVGPVSIASLVMGTMLSEVVSYTEQPILYLQLAFTATLFAGVFQASLGFFRLGFIIDFLSKATLVGFMAGAAVIVSLQQLKGLLGMVHFTSKMQIVPVLSSVFQHKDEWSWQTIVMGVCFLAFLLTTRQISTRNPRFFWLSAASPLASVILSTLVVAVLKSKAHGIQTIGHLPKGLNPPSMNMLYLSGPYLPLAIKTGIVSGILALTEGIAVGRTFAALKNYQVDGNKEMMAIGLMNMAGSCSSCYVTTGSFSRSAVNYNAGAQTVVSNIIMATAVLITLLFLMPLFYYTPIVILAAIIITAVIGLIDYQAALRLYKVDKLDFLACLCSFFGVLFISVPLGLAIAVGVSVFKILLHVTRPNTGVLGNIPGTQVYQNLNRYRTAEGIAVGRTFAALKNYQVDGNKEMMAIGLMNMAGSCSSCYVTTGSFSRSAVNYNAGAQTVVSNIIMATAVLITLLFLMPLFYYTPIVILAAIIITAVIGLIDYQAALRLYKVDKLDFLACLCSFFGVLFISVPLGLAIAVGVSVFKILLHVTRPNTGVLGNIPGTQVYQNLNRYRTAVRIPSFLILAVEAPIYFANSTYLQERILRWIREEEERIAANKETAIKCVIIDMTAVSSIDSSGIDTICELRRMLDKRSLKLVLANPGGNVMEKLHESNALEGFGLNGIYLTVSEAVADISSLWKTETELPI